MPEISPTTAALAALFAEHHALVFKAAYRVTGDVDDAADALQAVFLRLIGQPESRIDGSQQMAGYLRRSAVNAALDIVRARQRRRVIPIDANTEAELADERSATSTPADTDQLPDYLRQALAGLSPRAAQMFVLHHFEGLPNSEIAGLFDISANVVGVTLHRTREQLRHILSAQLGGEE